MINRQQKVNYLKSYFKAQQLSRLYFLLKGKRLNNSLRNNTDNIINIILNFLNKRPVDPPRTIELPPLPEDNQSRSLIFRYINIPGDGDCFYNAIIRALKLTRISARFFRNSLMKRISSPNARTRLSLNKRDPNSWAQEEEIQATANLYNIRIAIWYSISIPPIWRIIEPIKKRPKQTVYLYNLGTRARHRADVNSGGVHFDLLELIN